MNMEAILITLTTVTVFIFFVGLYKSGLDKKVQAQERLQGIIGDGQSSRRSSAKAQTPNAGDSLLKKRKRDDEPKNFMDKLAIDMERANLSLRVSEFIIICVATAGVSLLFFWLGLRLFPLLAVLLALPTALLPVFVLKIKIWLRMGKAEAQFADVLDMLVNSFKSGFAFNRAIQQVSDNFDDPWGTEFGKMVAEMNLGAGQESALKNFSKRIPLGDVDLFTTALIIQKDTGGNMAELLTILSNTCRARYKLKRKISAISAQGKLSAGVITCVPFLLTGIMFAFLGEPVMKFITNPIGIVLLSITGIWMCVGIGVLFKIVQIDV